MNGQLFQTIKESKDATQYIITIEALERYAFKTNTVDLSSLFQLDNSNMPTIKIPEKPTDNKIAENLRKADIYQLQLKEYIKEEQLLKVALKSIWAVVWCQCFTSIYTKLKKCKEMKEFKKKANVVELLKCI